MKIILVGHTGIIGSEVLGELKRQPEVEVVTASRTSGEYTLDLEKAASIKSFFEKLGSFDALICTAGEAFFGPFERMKEEDFYVGIFSKLMGQVNLVMIGKEYISENGVFTLTSGFLSDDPVRGSIGYAIANGGVENFVKTAAIELKKGIRINVVSPGNVESPLFYSMQNKLNPGQLPVSAHKVTAAYIKSTLGFRTGQIFRVWESTTQYAQF